MSQKSQKTQKTSTTTSQTQTEIAAPAQNAAAGQQVPQGIPPQGVPFQGIPQGVPPPHAFAPPPHVFPRPPVVPVVPVVPGPPPYPRIDRTVDNNNYYVYADVPGMTKDQIKVEIKDKMLVISGERKNDHLMKEEKKQEMKNSGEPELKLFPIIERFYGQFERRIPIPEDGDINTFKTKLENGVLEITVKKKAEAKK